MATSGTVGTTIVGTEKILEHALRRCGINATAQTPEIVSLALDNLFLLLLEMSARGLNLWCVDKLMLPVVAGQVIYPLPAGTIDILNMSYARCTYVTGSASSTATSYTTTLTSTTQILRAGFTLSANPITPLLVQSSTDNITWTTTTTIPVAALATVGVLQFADIGVSNASGATYWRLYADGSPFTATSLLLISAVSELPMTQMNRDSYTALPNKYIQGSPSVNYYYEKLVTPQLSLWPVANDSTCILVVWRYRQPQDVGSLTQTLEIPARWYETIIWALAQRLTFEIPQVDPARQQQVMAMAQQTLSVTEGGETDGSPVYLTPRISVYTR